MIESILRETVICFKDFWSRFTTIWGLALFQLALLLRLQLSEMKTIVEKAK